jgi:phenylpropionate dioxygenase-like ring-hydroxylating dioxygenase large terminal subunit
MTRSYAVDGQDKPSLPVAASLANRDMCDAPPPYPYSWYAVAFSSDLKPGGLVSTRFLDREIVVFRTRSGKIHAAEAYCPHLGAHLGDGSVEGEELRCPFHGFKFGGSGACVYSPYGVAPPAARLGMLITRDVAGAVMVWHGPPGETPWEIDELEQGSDWRTLRTRKSLVRTHPQEMTENGVDIGHLIVLHGFDNVRVLDPFTTDGPRARMRYAFTTRVPLIGSIDTEIRIRVDGLGFSVVETQAAGWQMRQLIVGTPIGEREAIVHAWTSVRSRGKSRIGRVLWRPLDALLDRVLSHEMFMQLVRDEVIWGRKKYLRRPALGAGDGPIGKYRAWARQFYPDSSL